MTADDKSTSRDMKKAYPLRVDPELFEKVKADAITQGRSVNKHIEYLLRQGLRKEKQA